MVRGRARGAKLWPTSSHSQSTPTGEADGAHTCRVSATAKKTAAGKAQPKARGERERQKEKGDLGSAPAASQDNLEVEGEQEVSRICSGVNGALAQKCSQVLQYMKRIQVHYAHGGLSESW